MVTAENDFSRNWQEETVSGLLPWMRDRLEVVRIMMLKKTYQNTIRIPSLDPVDLRWRIEGRHPDFDTSGWRVWSAENRVGPDIGTFLLQGLPESSVRALRERGFLLNWGLSNLIVRVDEKPAMQVSGNREDDLLLTN